MFLYYDLEHLKVLLCGVLAEDRRSVRRHVQFECDIVAIFDPFGQFCEISISLLSLQTQPNTAQYILQRGVEYGKYV